MAFSPAQAAIGNSGVGSSFTASFGSNNTAGNLITLVVESLTATPGVSDSQGNTYTLLDNISTGWFYYAYNIKGGANTITVTGLNNPISFLAIEWPTIITTNPLDVHNAQSQSLTSGANTLSSPSVTTTYTNELVVGWCAGVGGVGSPTVTVGSGFGNFADEAQAGSPYANSALENLSSTSIATETATFNVTVGTTVIWYCGVAVFKGISSTTGARHSLASLGVGS